MPDWPEPPRSQPRGTHYVSGHQLEWCQECLVWHHTIRYIRIHRNIETCFANHAFLVSMYIHLKHADIKREYYLWDWDCLKISGRYLVGQRSQCKSKISQLWFPETKLSNAVFEEWIGQCYDWQTTFWTKCKAVEIGCQFMDMVLSSS